MTNQEIYELMARFDQSGLTTLKVTRKDFSLELGKNVTVAAAPVVAPVAAPAAAAAPVAEPVEEGTFVTAPLVGTFYAAPAPGAEPFVHVGSKVKKGETLCVIEAMKVMNEVTAEADGEIVDICVKDGDLVEYGCCLMKIY